MSMSDLIDRQAAIDACLNGWNKDYKEIIKEIRALPLVKPEQKMEREIADIKEVLKVFIRHLRPDGDFSPLYYNEMRFLLDKLAEMEGEEWVI